MQRLSLAAPPVVIPALRKRESSQRTDLKRAFLMPVFTPCGCEARNDLITIQIQGDHK